MVCVDCGHIAYENPKIIVGAVIVADDSVLLCRGAIEPHHGLWTLPAGYLELGETLEEGAICETCEEARARIELDGVLGIFSISRIRQVHVVFRARFSCIASPPLRAAGAGSLEVDQFACNTIPWDHITFPSTRWALGAWRRSGTGPPGTPASNPRKDARGTRPGGYDRGAAGGRSPGQKNDADRLFGAGVVADPCRGDHAASIIPSAVPSDRAIANRQPRGGP
jgi:ADP-ribose pyrophosphatase YjhB (NUDIX family)